MVKNVVKKMQGLNKVQATEVAVYNQSATPAAGAPQSAVFTFESPDIPNVLLNLVPPLGGSDSHNQTYIKRCTLSCFITNTTETPIWVRTVRCTARKNVMTGGGYGASADAAIRFMLADDVTGSYSQYVMPYQSPLTGITFQQNFKITSNTLRLKQPNAMWKFSIKRNFGNRPLTNENDAASNLFLWRRGNRFVLWFFYGAPYQNLNESSVQLGNSKIAMVKNHYISYYNMGDIDPNSSGQTAINATRPTQMQVFKTQSQAPTWFAYSAGIGNAQTPVPIVDVNA